MIVDVPRSDLPRVVAEAAATILGARAALAARYVRVGHDVTVVTFVLANGDALVEHCCELREWQLGRERCRIGATVLDGQAIVHFWT